MEDARYISMTVERLTRRDPTLKRIILNDKYWNSELSDVFKCLIEYPGNVSTLYLFNNRLTNSSGTKIAKIISLSTALQRLSLVNNKFTCVTHLAVATALRVNTSLQYLALTGNRDLYMHRVHAAFVEALRLNPNRPVDSQWNIESCYKNEYTHLKAIADVLGPPSMLAQLDFAQDCLPSTGIRK